jgi:DNA-binding IclR family transcriptional regulator
MNRYNKLKTRTLNVFAFAPGTWFKPGEVAEQLNFAPRRAVWTYLKRLWKFGLLERHTTGTGTLKYKLSEGGTARLRWLRSHKNS